MTGRLANALLAAAALLGACSKSLQPPSDAGVCWGISTPRTTSGKPGKPVFNKVAEGLPNMESCAIRLEDMRTRFLRLGGNRTTIDGAWQGRFLFVQREGVFSAQSLEGSTYLAIPRGSDGRLVIPGTAPTPYSRPPVY